MRWAGVAAAVGLIAAPASALAHHSISAMYDREKAISAAGVLTKLELINPHSAMQVEIRVKGEPVDWTFETAGPTGLNRLGLNRDNIAVGDRVTLIGYPARDGSRSAWLTKLKTKDRTFDISYRLKDKAPKPRPAT